MQPHRASIPPTIGEDPASGASSEPHSPHAEDNKEDVTVPLVQPVRPRSASIMAALSLGERSCNKSGKSMGDIMLSLQP